MDTTYYGNTVFEWLRALAIIVGAAVAGKLIYWFFKTVVRRLTARTKTNLDDILVDMIEEPLVLAATVAGVYVGLSTLALGPGVESFFSGGLRFVVVLCGAWLLVRLVDSLFVHYVSRLVENTETDLDDQLLPLLRKGAKLIIWSIGIVVALNNAGYDVGALIAGLGIGGLALAMAARDTVSNVFGGFTVITDRPFVLGDRIRAAGFDGTVKEIGVRSVRLETLEGRTVTIPNATFTDTPVENVSSEPSRKVVLELGLTYDTDPAGMRRGLELLREIAAGTEGLEETVYLGFTGFGDFAMTLLFIYYIAKDADILETQTAVNLAVLERFAEAGLEMAFPTQTIHAEVTRAAAS